MRKLLMLAILTVSAFAQINNGGTGGAGFTPPVTATQSANGANLEKFKRFTDTAPTGFFELFRDNADATTLWSVDVAGAAVGTSLALSGSTTLTPSSAANGDIGSAALPFRDLWIAGSSATPGTNNFRVTGTATAARVITLPDVSDTLAGITSPLLTTPKITTINDGNGNPFLASSATASAVDSVTITNAATGNPANVSIGSSGTDGNVSLTIKAKGATGIVAFQQNGSTRMALNSSGQLDLNGGDLITDSAGSLTVRGGGGGHLFLDTNGGSGIVSFRPQGHVENQDTNQVTAPVIHAASCGTTPSVVSGSTDNAIYVLVGTGGAATSCQVDFGKAFAKSNLTHPVCTVNSDTDKVGLAVSYVTGASVIVTATAAFTASSHLNILCF